MNFRQLALAGALLAASLAPASGALAAETIRVALGTQPRPELGLGGAEDQHPGLAPSDGSGTRHGASVSACVLRW